MATAEARCEKSQPELSREKVLSEHCGYCHMNEKDCGEARMHERFVTAWFREGMFGQTERDS